MATPTVRINVSGARGESFADIARRTGLYGVLPTDTDAVALSKLNAAAEAAAAFVEGFTGPVYANVAAGEAATTAGQVFRVNAGGGVLAPYLRTSSGSDALAPLATTANLLSGDADKGTAMIGRQTGGTLAEALQGTINAAEFGMSPSKTAAQNSAALKAAVAHASAGDRIIIPPGAYNMRVTGGLSDAVTINKALTLEINGTLTANGFAVQANPYYMFRVTAADVVFTGTGTLAGNGTVDDLNSGDTTTHPGLIYVDGDRFTFGGNLSMVNVPKVGIVLANCRDAQIGGRWTGGPTAYGQTAYFGIIATGGGGHIFEGFRAVRDGAGGRIVNFIFASGIGGAATNCTVRNGYADVWEKVFYGHGDGHYVHDNEGIGQGHSDWIRFNGSNCRAYRNKVSGANSGVSAYNGRNIEVCDNTFVDCKQIGVYVARLGTTYTGGFNGLKIADNTLLGDSASPELMSGVLVINSGSVSSGALIANNRVENFGPNGGDALIKVVGTSGAGLNDVKIIGNKLSSTARAGILVDQVTDSVIESNSGSGIGTHLLAQTNSARLRWLNNTGAFVGNIGIAGFSSDSEASGNRFTATPLAGFVTVSAGVTHTVAHGGVAPHAQIFLQTRNAAAGVMIPVKGAPLTAVNGSNFDIASANGTAFSGTEQFFYRIEQ